MCSERSDFLKRRDFLKITGQLLKSVLWYMTVRNNAVKFSRKIMPFPHQPPTKCSPSQKQANWVLTEGTVSLNHGIFPLFMGKWKGPAWITTLWASLASSGLLSSIFLKCLQMFSINFLLQRSLPFWHDSWRPSVTDWNQACAKLLYASYIALCKGLSFLLMI